MSIASLPPLIERPGPFSQHRGVRTARVPARFYLAFAALFAIFVATAFSSISPLKAVVYDPNFVNPVITFLTVAACGTLLIAAIGSPDLKPSAAIKILLIVFELGVLVDIFEVTIHIAVNGRHIAFIEPIAALFSEKGEVDLSRALMALLLNFSMVALEELSKLGVILVFIRLGKIRTAQAAMACAALAGFTFGLIESNVYGYASFVVSGSALPEFMSRYFIMPAVHALWDVLGAGLAFYLAGMGRDPADSPRPGTVQCIIAFAVATFVHNAHNILQFVIGSYTQFVTVFALLLPTYVLAKRGWRAAPKMEPRRFSGAFALGFLAILMTAGSLAMTRVPMRLPVIADTMQHYRENVETLQSLVDRPQTVDTASAAYRGMRYQFESFRPAQANVHDAMLEVLDVIAARSKNPPSAPGTSPYLEFWPDRPNVAGDVDQTIHERRPDLLLDRCRFVANQIGHNEGFEPSFEPVDRWEIRVRRVELARAVYDRFRPQSFCLIVITTDNSRRAYLPAARSRAFNKAAPLSPADPWSAALHFRACEPALCIAAVAAGGELLPIDRVALTADPHDGYLFGENGSRVHIELRHEHW